MSKKRYVIDTSVLLHDPTALFNFKDNDIYIPLAVIAELDKFKKGNEEINANAREVIRAIEHLTTSGVHSEGIDLGQGGKLFFHLPNAKPEERSLEKLMQQMKEPFADPVLLQYASFLQNQDSTIATSIVTKDTVVRILAREQQIAAEDYLHDKAKLDLHAFFKQEQLYDVAPKIIDELYQQGVVDVPADFGKIELNQYLVLRSTQQSVLAKYRKGKFQRIKEIKAVEKIRPQNYGQQFLLDACLDQDLTIVAALGKAGTGKTVVSLAAGLYQVMEEEGASTKKYDKVVVIRPTLELGQQLGYLPGMEEEKIAPHFRPINTAMHIILGKTAVDYVGREEWIECMPINFVSGDTFHNTYVLVDEAQNFSRKEMKMIGTRLGSGSKLVIVGDPFQVHNPYLDEKDNGLTVVTDRLRGKAKEFAYVILDKGVRSPEAEIFADLL